jgi:DNA polymerase-4
VAKPDGLVVVEPDLEREFLDPLPVRLIWGVGPVTQARLAAVGIRTVGELAATSSAALEHLLGSAAGAKLTSGPANADPRRIETSRAAASVGAQAALGSRAATPDLVRATLGYLADRVAGRLRAGRRAGRTVSVRVRFGGLRSVTRSLTVPVALSATLTLTEVAVDLAMTALADHPQERRVTLLAISVSNLIDEPALQLELPLAAGADRHRPGTRTGAARWGVDRSVDAVRARFGRSSIGYATVEFSDVARVPEAFRALAEHPPATE